MKIKVLTDISLICALAIVVAFIPAVSASSESEEDDTARRLHQTVVELEALREQSRAEEAERKREREAVQEQITELEQDTSSLETEIEDLREEISFLENREKSYQAEKNEIHHALRLLSDTAETITRKMIPRITYGVSVEYKERLQRLGSVLAEFEAEDTEVQAEGVSAFVERALHELQLSRQRELRNEPIILDDEERIHAYVYRLGLLTEGFVDERGRRAGIRDTSNGDWHIADAELKELLKEIVAMMRQKQTPSWLEVPVMKKVVD